MGEDLEELRRRAGSKGSLEMYSLQRRISNKNKNEATSLSGWLEAPFPVEVNQMERFQDLIVHSPVLAAYFLHQFEGIQHIDREHIKHQYRPQDIPQQFIRYAGNIYPYESNRVVLPVFGESDATSGGDFLNASHIPGTNHVNYIVSEAPTIDAINSFYRLVWAHDVKMIVMLTGLIEHIDGKEWHMASQYWPSVVRRPRTRGAYSEYTVDMERETHPLKNLKERVINITFHPDRIPGEDQKGQLDQKRQFVMLHQTGWLDGTAPDMDEFKGLMSHFRRLKEEIKVGNVLVHCSAGCGRSGTFVASDILIDQLEAGQTAINVCQVVRGLRHQRMGFVNSLEQYQFLHKVVVEHAGQQSRELVKMYTIQPFRQYTTYLGELKSLHAYKTQIKLLRLNHELLKIVLKCYVHSRKSQMFYYWRALVRHVEICFSNHTALTEKLFADRFMVNIRDRGHVYKMEKLVKLVEGAITLWKRDMSEQDREVSAHMCELDIYSCLSDLLEMATMLPYRNSLVMANSLDRLFWYRFFLRDDCVPIEKFATSLRLFLLVQHENLRIGGGPEDFISLLRACMTTNEFPKPTMVTPRMWGHFLKRYGPIALCYDRMVATSVPPGIAAPWFLPTYTSKQMPEFLARSSFGVRLSSDSTTFALHIVNKDPPVKIYLDGGGHFWEELRDQKDQRLADFRALLYQYVVEKCEMFGTERKMLDDEQVAWETFRNFTCVINRYRLHQQFTKQLCGANAEPSFDKFLRMYSGSGQAEDIFRFLDLDLNTFLDSHELRVGLYLVFEPLVRELVDVAEDKFEVMLNYRELEIAFLSWLPPPSSLTFKVNELEAEMTNMAAKFYVYFLAHTVKIAKDRSYRERFFSREVLLTFKAFHSSTKQLRAEAKGEGEAKGEEEEAKVLSERLSRGKQEELIKERAAIAIQKCWRIFIKHRINREFPLWVNGVVSNVVAELKQEEIPSQTHYFNVFIHSFLTILFLPFYVMHTVYLIWKKKTAAPLMSSVTESSESQNPPPKNKVCVQLGLTLLTLVLVALYYLPFVTIGLWVPDTDDNNLGKLHVTAVEVWMPFGVYVAVMLTVGVGFRANTKMTPLKWRWEKASLIVGQSECRMRSKSGVVPGNVSVLKHVLPAAMFMDKPHASPTRAGQVECYFQFLLDTYANITHQTTEEILEHPAHVRSLSRRSKFQHSYRPPVTTTHQRVRKRDRYFLLCFILAAITAFLPSIYRSSHDGYFLGTSHLEYLACISNILTTFASSFFFFIMLQASIHHYTAAKTALQKVLDVTQPVQAFGKRSWNFYLPLDEQGLNLCFWVQLRQVAKDQVNSSVLFVVGISFAAVIAAVLYIVVFFYVIAHDNPDLVDSINNVMAFWGALVLGAHILWLVLVVVNMNTDVEANTMRVLEEVRRNVVQSYTKLGEEMSRHQQFKEELNVERRYKSRHEILSKMQVAVITTEDLRERGDISCSIAEQEQRRRSGMQDEVKRKLAFLALVDSAVSEMKVLDEPVTLLGFTVNVEFRDRALASIIAFVFSVVSQSLNLFGN